MDIQYKNKKWELGWDKGIFALVLAIVGSLGYYLANKSLDNRRTEAMKEVEKDRREEARKLEEFRTREAGRRSLLDKQLPELFAINGAISDVTRVYFAHSGGQKAAAEEQKVRNEYKTALAKAREVINRSPFLFDLDFNKDLDRYYAVHSKMSELPTEKWGKYQGFAFDLSNKFDDLCRSVVNARGESPDARFRMPLSPIAQVNENACLQSNVSKSISSIGRIRFLATDLSAGEALTWSAGPTRPEEQGRHLPPALLCSSDRSTLTCAPSSPAWLPPGVACPSTSAAPATSPSNASLPPKD